MKRRTAACLLTSVALSVASMAQAQTTSTTSTTYVDPCAGHPCTQDPPQAFLSGSSGELKLDLGTYDWDEPGPTARSGHGFASESPTARLRVQAGEMLTLRFSALSPTAVSYDRGVDTATVTLTPGNPVRFRANLAAGSTPLLLFSTKWRQGNVLYRVQLDVTAAPRPVALTG